jgi:hypothetical protein
MAIGGERRGFEGALIDLWSDGLEGGSGSQRGLEKGDGSMKLKKEGACFPSYFTLSPQSKILYERYVASLTRMDWTAKSVFTRIR